MTLSFIQAHYTTRHGRGMPTIVDPETTSVKAVAKAGRALLDAVAEHHEGERRRQQAANAVMRLDDEALAEATAAGQAGKRVDHDKIRSAAVATEQRLREAELDYDASGANVTRLDAEYRATLAHHAPALLAEARGEADAAILSLTTASANIRRAEGTLAAALGLLATLPSVQEGGAFKPLPPLARRRTTDAVFEGGSPVVYAQLAGDNLGLAIGYAVRVLDDLADDEKARKAAAAEAAKAVVEPEYKDGDE